MKPLGRFLSRFRRCESGAPMVEFAMVLPVILLFFVVIIEGSRITWIHQATSAGVRDASRMIARIAPLDLCSAGGVASYDAMATDIVANRLGGGAHLPVGTTLVDVTPTCISRSGSYRIDPTSVVEVTAKIQIDFILGNVLGLFGGAVSTLDTVISDQSRVFGV
ncbi:TadE/TadG family type IV pilus assembly protein [Ruegeria faecimaris]|uniref:TadE-like protein n=1 Tax=Ruegeria faecimaris TaxID=686389 RepID=A0A521CD30_9RHOB|nr:TadE family protein [Ruegeria faecimaris]SMO56670.1 TadE-like protein [Ruegeria faecimaris]